MITRLEQYQCGRTAILGITSVKEADLEAAEQEVFPLVFGGVAWSDVQGDTPANAIIAEILPPFVWAEFQRNRAQYVKASGEVTSVASSYGVVSTPRVLRVWNGGVNEGRRLVAENAPALIAEYSSLTFIASFIF